jgi:hypothetical protein
VAGPDDSEEFYDGKLYVTNNADNFIFQVVGRDGDLIFLVNAFTPIDINEVYPNFMKVHKSELSYSYGHIEAVKPKFHLSQLCKHKKKFVYIRSRYYDFRHDNMGWQYVVTACNRGSGGVKICREEKLIAA